VIGRSPEDSHPQTAQPPCDVHNTVRSHSRILKGLEPAPEPRKRIINSYKSPLKLLHITSIRCSDPTQMAQMALKTYRDPGRFGHSKNL